MKASDILVVAVRPVRRPFSLSFYRTNSNRECAARADDVTMERLSGRRMRQREEDATYSMS